MRRLRTTVRAGVAGILSLVVAFQFACAQPSLAKRSEPERAWRLTVNYKSGTITLLRIDTLRTILPLTIKEAILEKGDVGDGFFFEMLDDSSKLVLRSRMFDPTKTMAEYEDPKNPGQIRSSEVVHDTITFTMVVPAPASARKIRIGRVPTSRDTTGGKALRKEYLGEFPLPKISR
jgi:hypothetical protein